MQTVLFKKDSKEIPFIAGKQTVKEKGEPDTLKSPERNPPNDDLVEEISPEKSAAPGKEKTKKKIKGKKKKRAGSGGKNKNVGLAKVPAKGLLSVGPDVLNTTYFYPSREEMQKLIQKACFTKQFKKIQMIANH